MHESFLERVTSTSNRSVNEEIFFITIFSFTSKAIEMLSNFDKYHNDLRIFLKDYIPSHYTHRERFHFLLTKVIHSEKAETNL